MSMAAPHPTVTGKSGPSLVWLIPLVTALVGGWLTVKTLSEQGPEITISFKTADGIEAGKTKVKYKNVDIGVVEEIQFGEDLSHVVLRGKFQPGTESFFRRNTIFWVVRPRLSLRGVSGLSTLISGAYIEVEPGPGAATEHFVGLEVPPVVAADEAGRRITLVTEKLGSVDTGSPIYYQGILAGGVLGYELGNDRKSVYVHAFIKDPFDQMIRGNTRFWNVSGMDVTVDADGFKIHTESMQAMIFGGIAFETPETLEIATDDVGDLVFTLFDTYANIEEQAYTKKVRFVMFFENSVRGLAIDAPVEFRGIKVGSVLDLRLEFNSEDTTFRIPVLVEIEPERIIERDDGKTIAPHETFDTLIERGLRARLQTGSMLTGQLFVELSMHPDSKAKLSQESLPYPELPTIPAANLASIAQSIERFMSRVDKVQIDDIGTELLSTLRGANKLVNAPAVQAAVNELEATLKSFRSILQKVEESNLQETINAGHKALDKLDETLTLTNRVLEPNSPLQYSFLKMTTELEETARSIRLLVDMLERNPQAFILGKDVEEK